MYDKIHYKKKKKTDYQISFKKKKKTNINIYYKIIVIQTILKED